MTEYYSLKWMGDHLSMIDQRRLPLEEVYLEYTDTRDVAEAIRTMVVRGAPAIGSAAGFGLALSAIHAQSGNDEGLLRELEKAGNILKAARPTAINLAWAVDRVLSAARGGGDIRAVVIKEAQAIFDEDVQANIQIGLNGLELVPQNARFIHHCNTGALATSGYGTALGVIRAAHEHGRNVFVYVDETRPRLQGSRLTAWELQKLGIPHKVIVDGASGHVMRTRGVDLCVVGCDRVAANGDTANKIGTFNLALAARAHNVPFYVVGPTSTIDTITPNGYAIPVEERNADEILTIDGQPFVPSDTPVFNPAFDITPHEYITAIVTEKGICRPPYEESIGKLKLY
jgi:methylthioribose-1-phosphate isomerase